MGTADDVAAWSAYDATADDAATDDAAIWAWQGTQGASYRRYCHDKWTSRSSRSSRTLSWTQTPQTSQEMEEEEVEEVQAKEALLRHKTQNRRIKHGHSLSPWTGIQGQSALHKVSRYCSLFSYSLFRKV